MITAGIDVGSVATKVVVQKDGKVLSQAVVPTGAVPPEAIKKCLSETLDKIKFSKSRIERIVATGYGRRTMEFEGKVVTEITAAARGADYLGSPWGKVRTIIDLGGQDTKVILLDEKGRMVDFVMNDKCAAGTGRFLEVMATVLGVPLEELGKLSLRATELVQINSTCTVFAESEVISLISQGKRREEIIAGLHFAIASRIIAMVKQVGSYEVFFFVGGGAQNEGIKQALDEQLGRKVYVPENPQFVVAFGAALLARE